MLLLYTNRRSKLLVLDRLFLICLFFDYCLYSNADSDADYIIQQIYAEQTQDADQNLDYESFYIILNAALQHPIDLNRATREDYQKLPFLNDIEIQNLLAYRRIYGKYLSTHQIQLVAHLRPQTVVWLPFFTIVSSVPLQITNKTYTHQHCLMAYQPKAHQRDYLRLRYQFMNTGKLQAGIHLENDAGEQPFENMGSDEIKAYIKWTPNSRLSTYLGDFSVGLGQGLLINQGYLLGKMSAFNSYRAHSFSVSSGSSPIYTQGLAVHLKYPYFEYKIFTGFRTVDASINGNYYHTFYDTGIHNSTQLKHENNLNELNSGFQIEYKKTHLKIALNSNYIVFSKKAIHPMRTHYNYPYYDAGISISYIYHKQNLSIIGENAYTLEGNYALQNTLQLSPLAWINCFIQQRYYTPHYKMRYAVALNEMGKVSNEAGVLLGNEIELSPKCRLQHYIDSYKSLAPTLQNAFEIVGYDYRFQLHYQVHAHCKMRLIGKYETKQRSVLRTQYIKQKGESVLTYLRWQIYYKKNQIEWQLFAQINQSDVEHKGGLWNNFDYWKRGEVVGSEIQWRAAKKRFALNYRYELFDIPDYANRIYLYEHNVSYYMYNPLLYGRGMRTYLFLQYRYHNWRFQSKYSLTHTQNNTHQDLRLNLEYKF